MRTRLTLDKDVAAVLDRLCKQGDVSYRTLGNDALRRGLRQTIAAVDASHPYVTPVSDAGACRLHSIDRTAEVLALAGDESFKS